MDMDLSERRFEEDIESYLINEAGYRQLSALDENHRRRNVSPYDAHTNLYFLTFVEFVQKTQPDVMKKYERLYGDNAGMHLIDQLYKAIDSNGLIYVLRNGFIDLGTKIRVCYFKPNSELNETANRLYSQNIFGVARQFHYSESEESEKTIDMVLSLNGIPLFALELKNQFKGQNYEDAIEQFKTDRNPHEYCFKLDRRFLAYFAVDLDEVWVSTKLAGTNTTFVPFNQGSNGAGKAGGKGNPETEDGYKTSYLWEKVFQKDSVSKLLQKYLSVVDLMKEDEVTGKKRVVSSILFPRYHQLDVVDKIVNHVKSNGSGHNYLVEHSAGSGKSNSIAWLAYQLSSLHDEDNNPVFTSTIVVTNRIVLDNQLQETIKSFEHDPGLLAVIDKKSGSAGLKDAINDKKRIIICTIQKFLIAYKDFDDLRGRTFAIIIDEAHQGQSGESAKVLRSSLMDIDEAVAKYAYEEGVDTEEVDLTNAVVASLISQGQHENQSFFAFTATPKRETLELFGEYDPDTGLHVPFHVYSMRQAIEEGFILDVLQNFTAIKQAFKFLRTTDENPELVECDATRALMNYYKNNETTIGSKVEVIMTNFLNSGRFKINGHGKAMVVTDSRKAAVNYYFAIKNYIAAHPEQCRGTNVLVAFSDEVRMEGQVYSEATLNIDDEGNSINTDKKFRTAIRSDKYNIMVVADKYQMGFDEPLLHSMYIDKVLKDVNAVQTISRLNRSCPGKDDTFVLDFVNTEDDIKNAFQPYYEETALQGDTDCNKVYSLKREIANYCVYDQHDVDQYYDFMIKHQDSNNAIGGLRNCLSPAIGRYNQIDDEKERLTFRMALHSFVKCYSYVTSLVSIHDTDLYKEFVFVSALTKFLPIDKRDIVDITNKVALEYVTLKTTFEGEIILERKDTTFTPASGKKKPKSIKKDTLQSIIDRLNDIFGEDFSEGDRQIVRGIYDKFMGSKNAKRYRTIAQNNDKNLFVNEYFSKEFGDLAMECYEENESTYQKLTNDSDFYKQVLGVMGELIYRELKKKDDE